MPEQFGGYAVVFDPDPPQWVITTLASRVKRRLKKNIIKAGKKWIPSTFTTIVRKPVEYCLPWDKFTTVGIKVDCVPSKRRKESLRYKGGAG